MKQKTMDTQIRSISKSLALFALCLFTVSQALAQAPTPQAQPAPPDEVGKTTVGGKSVPYRIRRLPISSFPDLPRHVVRSLTDKGCLIPQTSAAHHPENAVHGSFEVAGSYDWAVLCSAKGRVSLLMFLASQADEEPAVLAEYAETDRLSPTGTGGELGFNWGIDTASPQQVHEAQAGQNPRPALADHDAVADSTVSGTTNFYFSKDGGQHWDKLLGTQNK